MIGHKGFLEDRCQRLSEGKVGFACSKRCNLKPHFSFPWFPKICFPHHPPHRAFDWNHTSPLRFCRKRGTLCLRFDIRTISRTKIPFQENYHFSSHSYVLKDWLSVVANLFLQKSCPSCVGETLWLASWTGSSFLTWKSSAILKFTWSWSGILLVLSLLSLPTYALVTVVSSSSIPQWLVTFINLSKFSEKMGYSSIGCSTQVLVLLVDVLAMVCCLPSLFRCSSYKDDVELRVLMESHCKIFCLLSLWLFYHLLE